MLANGVLAGVVLGEAIVGEGEGAGAPGEGGDALGEGAGVAAWRQEAKTSAAKLEMNTNVWRRGTNRV
jgi:hypothetical protein